MNRSYILPLCLLTAALLLGGCSEPQNTPDPTASPVAVIDSPVPDSVTLFGETVKKDAERITVQMPVDSFAPVEEVLSALPGVREAEIVFSAPWSDDVQGYLAYLAFRDAHPDLNCVERYPQGGSPADTTELVLPAPVDRLERLLSSLPALQTLTLPSELSREAIASVVDAYPAIRILWTDEAFGASDADARRLDMTGDPDPSALAAYLACFRALETVDLHGCSLSEADGNALCDAFPDIMFLRNVTLNGVPTDTGAEELNFDNAEIDSFEAFADALRFFPALHRLEMNDCSLTNEQLASLRDRYPEKGVVWTIHIRNYSLRTDSVAFSTKSPGGNPKRLKSADVDALRYCTDLIALDLGHNDMTDLDFLLPLKNLQLLMLADSRKLEDISVIGTLTKLKYLELFMTNVSDITPLASLSELLDVNLCITRVVDLSPLLSCKKLERIWIGQQTQKYTDAKSLLLLQEAFPNAEFDVVSPSCTGHGWREHARYFAYMEMFDTNQPVAPFLP